jgi:hypothetical protein
LKHPHILPLLGVDERRTQSSSMRMVSPLMEQGNVLDYMKRLGPENVDVLDLVCYALLVIGKTFIVLLFA